MLNALIFNLFQVEQTFKGRPMSELEPGHFVFVLFFEAHCSNSDNQTYSETALPGQSYSFVIFTVGHKDSGFW